MTMRIRRPLVAFFVLLALLLAGGIYAAQSDAHGWHWTKCRQGVRYIRGHHLYSYGYNWYAYPHTCSGTWAFWEKYYVSTVWP